MISFHDQNPGGNKHYYFENALFNIGTWNKGSYPFAGRTTWQRKSSNPCLPKRPEHIAT